MGAAAKKETHQEWVTVESAAEHFSMPYNTMIKHLKLGKYPTSVAIKAGHRWKINVPKMEAHFKRLTLMNTQMN